MSKIQAKEKTVRELLSNVEYSIDYYQREYAWEYKHIEALLYDLATCFRGSYSPEHQRSQVKRYPHYFLGTIITVEADQQKYIVDGQQRLTTITLLLICIHHLSEVGNGAVSDVTPMIYSDKYGSKSLNLNVEDRNTCMQALFETGDFNVPDHASPSVRNLVARYEDISTLFPQDLIEDELPYFVDWLIENVDLVEIEASTSDLAFTIFETMNDRGLPLKAYEMLKGYLLSNIRDEDANWVHENKNRAEEVWKRQVLQLGEDTVHEFFKAWLRSKYAITNNDYDKIDQFHRWVRDNRTLLDLQGSQEFHDFVTLRFDRFSKLYVKMHQASWSLTKGREEIYYNNSNKFTLQYLLALSPVCLKDDDEIAWKKIRLVTVFLDIVIARRMVNSEASTYDRMHNQVFRLAKNIRGMDVSSLQVYLVDYLEQMHFTFEPIFVRRRYSIFSENYFRMKTSNNSKRIVHYLLARMTAWVEQQCLMNSDFTWYERGGWQQIEHLMSNNYSSFQYGHIEDEQDYKYQRSLFGALVLLPRGTNQSFADAHYNDKVHHYIKQNLLAASLHPQTYERNPNFTNFVRNSGLPFRPHTKFKKEDLLERQELYRQICEQIWSPDRLLLDN